MLLNIQGMNPGNRSKSKWKMEFFKKFIDSYRTDKKLTPAAIAITETHLKSYVEDAQVKLPEYQVYRADRAFRSCGGVLLYIHNNIAVTGTETFDNGTCGACVCVSLPCKSIIISAYRPPDCPSHKFIEMLKFLKDCIEENPNCEINIMGDFNLPNINWTNRSISVISTDLSESTRLGELSESARLLLDFLDSNFLSQYVDKGTRLENILDLILSNSPHVIHEVSSSETSLSDHNIIDILLDPNNALSFVSTNKISNIPQGFRALDFSNASFKKINKKLSEIDWDLLASSHSHEEFPVVFNNTVLEICKQHCPPKSTDKNKAIRKSRHGRHIHALGRKKRKLKGRLNALKEKNPSSKYISVLEKDIGKLCLQIKDTMQFNQMAQEKRVIGNIKTNPKAFYSYVKKNSKTKSLINLLINQDKEVITDSKAMADLFQDYFLSQYSVTRNQPKFNNLTSLLLIFNSH